MQLQALQELVHKTRDARRKQTLPKFPANERDTLIKQYHPDSRENAYQLIKFGPNAGELTVRELAVLVVGGGGAGSAAAPHAPAHGAKVLLASKLRLGDSTTVMAAGGIQIAITD